jgi:spore maturation protein CgeB
MKVTRLLIVGEADTTSVGTHFLQAAAAIGVSAELCDSREAFAGPALLRRASWRLLGHRPPRMAAFGRRVVETMRRFRPDVVLASGLAPIGHDVLVAAGALGVRRLNFLTDDPWNPAHHAPWFLRALPLYDIVFSPRHANLDDLRRRGVTRVEYLPFAYNPTAHRPAESVTDEDRRHHDADVLVVGAADADRVSVVDALLRAGLRVALFGGYWSRFGATRASARGVIDLAGQRTATAVVPVCLGLVRRANRDGHSMRTFEIPAMRGCMLAEDTPDHRELFGDDGETVTFFRDTPQLVRAVKELLARPGEQARLRAAAHARILAGHHTYADRLVTMIGALP